MNELSLGKDFFANALWMPPALHRFYPYSNSVCLRVKTDNK
jgi:hypothetical protein